MRIAVLGGGHGAYAAAAEMAEAGHEVRFWRRDAAAFGPILADPAITVTDFRGTREVRIGHATTDLGEAVRGAELILPFLPATAHGNLAGALAPHLADGQVVFLAPGTLGTMVFARELERIGNAADVSFGETGTLPYLVRKHGPAAITVSAYATRLPTGIYPLRNAAHAAAVMTAAFPAIELCGDILSGALMNAGPVIHPPLILMNAGPLEHFERWDIHNEGTQPAVRRTTDALDAERIALREQLGYGTPHFPLADHYSADGEAWMYGNAAHERLTDSGDWRETIDLRTHRYMTEDTAIGLSLLVSLGARFEVPVPIAAGMLAIASAITGRDLYAESDRTLEALGLADLSDEALAALLRDGIAA